ncbi:hypothetical protein [Endozoicomonas lisbonensis]|uniref:HNH nuclease domain-containing protein n=1 Tax=Endozoicomonas lisbonensis TaxID=3120522 RepID=A0ABV2SC89_9GAMM
MKLLYTGLQYGRFDYKDGEPEPGKGVKGDLTFISAETDPHSTPVLGMHTHHNNPVFAYYPYYTSEPLEMMTERLTDQGRLDMFTMTPDIINYLVRGGGTRLTNPKGNAALFHIFRIHNHPIFRSDFAPNKHTMYERVNSRERLGKGAKEWLNNDFFSVFKNVFYSYPYKSDISLKVAAHILPKAGDQSSAGWEKLFDDQWVEVAELPDMLVRTTDDGSLGALVNQYDALAAKKKLDDKEQAKLNATILAIEHSPFRKGNMSDFFEGKRDEDWDPEKHFQQAEDNFQRFKYAPLWPGGLYWSAFYLDEPR